MPLVCQSTAVAEVVSNGVAYPIIASGVPVEVCTSWVLEDLADAEAIGITSADIAATAGGVAGGIVGLYLFSFAIGNFMRLIHKTIVGD